MTQLLKAAVFDPVGKTCSECRRDRPLARFATCKHAPDGRLNRCLDCICATAQRHRLEREQRRMASPASTSITESPNARIA
jgi:hypothetical protein